MSEAGEATQKALLDAAETLLISKGVADITTRKVADKAGVNQALVHYHFGTIEELLLAVLERVSQSVKERSKKIYTDDGLFFDGWLEEMEEAITTDFEQGWGKIWLENLTLAANRPLIRKQYVKASSTVRKLHERRLNETLERLGIDTEEFPAKGLVTLLDAITSKIILDRLVGISAGHRELLSILRRVLEQFKVGDYEVA
jgi:AcrR family transcriptional regulator